MREVVPGGSRLQSQTALNVWRARAVYALLFLLPVAGISVRHWISTTFALLVLLSLPDVFRRDHRLLRPERNLMVIAALFFGVYLATSFVNGWADLATRAFGRELRFLLLIPIYLMARRHPDAGVWLLRGGIVGGFALLAQALYDVYALGLGRAQGFYSPNLIGPYGAVIAVTLLVLWRLEQNRRWLQCLALVAAMAALGAVALSGSRGAYMGLLGMLLVWGGLSFRGRYFAAAVAGIVGLVVLSYVASDRVRLRIDTAMTEMEYVVETDDLSRTERHLGSVPTRVEMWHVSWLIFRDNPIFGVGRGNYTNAARAYVARGAVHPDVAVHSHPHNAYLEMLVSKGILGLAAFLALLFYPLVVFGRTRQQAPETAALGIVFVTGFALFSVSDASTFIKGNFISIFVIYLAVLFAWHMRRSGAAVA